MFGHAKNSWGQCLDMHKIAGLVFGHAQNSWGQCLDMHREWFGHYGPRTHRHVSSSCSSSFVCIINLINCVYMSAHHKFDF